MKPVRLLAAAFATAPGLMAYRIVGFNTRLEAELRPRLKHKKGADCLAVGD
jgi:hypothetical protein